MAKQAGKRVAVIGGGWAGCTAAVELSRHGHQVTLFESARTLGGRARRVAVKEKVLDNGQHILLGAYSETLRLMRIVGIDIDQSLLTLPLQMRYPPNSGGMDFIAPRLPAPLHVLVALWRSKGLATEDKMALARFSTTARWMGWTLNVDCSVAELLARFDQTARIIQLMWRPLCIAALNTPPERASAQVFLNVLRDSLGAKRSASDMLVPRVDLSALYPQACADFIEQRGGKLRYGASVKKIVGDGTGWQLDINGGDSMSSLERFDALVVATQAEHAAVLLEGHTSVEHLANLHYEPITTCYLQYGSDIRLDQPFFALLDDAGNNEFGQFVFDRGQLDASQAGLLAVVVSASTDAVGLDQQALVKAVAAQLAKVLRVPALLTPQWSKVISEKRATFSCTPGLTRPTNDVGLPNLFIAGDYVAGDYPATLESAVRSGLGAAKAILANSY